MLTGQKRNKKKKNGSVYRVSAQLKIWKYNANRQQVSNSTSIVSEIESLISDLIPVILNKQFPNILWMIQDLQIYIHERDRFCS